jgi:hypothetical protein
MVITNARALRLAETHGLAGPRLIAADLDGRASGTVATLETFLSGSSDLPPMVSAARLREAGAAIARVNAVVLAPQADLPPWRAADDRATDRRRGRTPTDGRLLVFNTWSVCESLIDPSSCPKGTPPGQRIYDEKIWRIVGRRKTLILGSRDQAGVLAVAAGRILVRRADGSLQLRKADGRLLHTFPSSRRRCGARSSMPPSSSF